jgi:hypothetical protein
MVSAQGPSAVETMQLGGDSEVEELIWMSGYRAELPDGFGVPLLSSQQLLVATQVLNHNVVADPFAVRERVTLSFVRDADLTEPMRPLIQHGIYGLTLVKGTDGHIGIAPGAADEEIHGPGCSMAVDIGHHGGPDRAATCGNAEARRYRTCRGGQLFE